MLLSTGVHLKNWIQPAEGKWQVKRVFLNSISGPGNFTLQIEGASVKNKLRAVGGIRTCHDNGEAEIAHFWRVTFVKTIFCTEYHSIQLNQRPANSIKCTVGNNEVTAASVAKQNQIIPLDRYSDDILKALPQFTGVLNNGGNRIFCNQNELCHCWKGFRDPSCLQCKYS